MTNFLFWNLKKKQRLQSTISRLAWTYEVDILMFAECKILPNEILLALNQETVCYHYAESIGCEKVVIFTKFPKEFIPPKQEGSRFTIRHLKLPGSEDILLVVVHFPSKANMKDSSQDAECYELSNSIKETEKEVGHCKTVLVGDLNMNPFQEGVINANGLHGVMSRAIAKKKNRRVQGKTYPFFYNPMWNLFGDATPGTPGT